MEGCGLAEEELPYVGYLAGTEYLCNNSDCSTEGDGIPKVVAEDNERVDVDMELAVAVALDLMEGKLSRRQAENRMAEDQFARGRPPRADTAQLQLNLQGDRLRLLAISIQRKHIYPR